MKGKKLQRNRKETETLKKLLVEAKTECCLPGSGGPLRGTMKSPDLH